MVSKVDKAFLGREEVCILIYIIQLFHSGIVLTYVLERTSHKREF